MRLTTLAFPENSKEEGFHKQYQFIPKRLATAQLPCRHPRNKK